MTDLNQVSDADLLASLPRGIRNNNPLNLKTRGTAGQDGPFARYNTPDEGIAAADRNLQAYSTKHGLNTVAGIVNRWAPPNADGNHTQAYTAHVASRMGVEPNATLDMVNPETRKALIGAMGEFENGAPIAPAQAPANPLADVSDAELLASLPKAPATPVRPPQRATAGPSPAQPNLAKDVGLSAIYGTGKGAANVGDMLMAASPLGMGKMMLRNTLNLANLADGQGSVRPAMMPGMSLLSNREATMDRFTPQTEAGKFTHTAATFLPNAVLPGTAAERVASVVAPAVGQESFQRGAKALGLGEQGQQVAGVLGATLGGLTTGVRLNRQPATKSPTADLAALDTAQKAAWRRVDASTYKFAAKDTRAAAKDVRALVSHADPDLYPESAKFAAKLERMVSRGELTLGKLNTLKSQMGEKLLQPGSTEASVGRQMSDRVEALINTSQDTSLTAAREAYKRFKKVQDVTKRVDDAELNRTTAGTGGNGNAVRQALKPLVKQRGGQRMTNATPDETKAIKRVVNGTPGQNALRMLTAFDPTAGKLQAFISGIAGAGTMGKSLLLAPVGMVAKAGERKIEDANVQKLLDLLASGGKAPKGVSPLKVAPNPYAFAPGVTGALLAAPAAAAPRPKRKPPQR